MVAVQRPDGRMVRVFAFRRSHTYIRWVENGCGMFRKIRGCGEMLGRIVPPLGASVQDGVARWTKWGGLLSFSRGRERPPRILD